VDIDVAERGGGVGVEGFLERGDERRCSSWIVERDERGQKCDQRRERGVEGRKRTNSVDSLFGKTTRLDLFEKPVDDSRDGLRGRRFSTKNFSEVDSVDWKK